MQLARSRDSQKEHLKLRCHFVPRSYLKRFCNSKNLLDCFDLHRESMKPKAPKTTSQIEDWYVLKGMDQLPGFEFRGEKHLEEEFQRLFENDLTSALDRLEARELTPEDKDKLATFIAFQLHRPPISRQYYREMQDATAKQPLAHDEQLRRNAQVAYGFLGTAVSALALAPFLVESEWMLVRGDGSVPFITSDNPVGVNGHPSNTSFVRELVAHGVSGPELRARSTAYVITVSPRHMLYVNTSAPANARDANVREGRWDEARVRAYNDLVFRSSLSCVFTVTRDIANEYCTRFKAGEITNDLFVDDPWGEAG